MTGRAGDEDGREEWIGEVLGGYLEAVEAGRAPMLAELLARHPDLAGGGCRRNALAGASGL